MTHQNPTIVSQMRKRNLMNRSEIGTSEIHELTAADRRLKVTCLPLPQLVFDVVRPAVHVVDDAFKALHAALEAAMLQIDK